MNKKNIDFLELVKNRESVRAYDTRHVEPEKIERCLEAARLAPSACNAQPWKFVVVTDPELRSVIADASHSRVLSMNHFTKQAPVLVVLVRERPNFTSQVGTIVKRKTYTLIDVGIAAEHFCLQATAEGLGTCMMGWFDEPKVKKLLGIPKTKRAELIITVGYPQTDELRDKKRKSFDDIVSYNAY